MNVQHGNMDEKRGTPGEPLLRLAGVSKTFPGQQALAGVDVEFRAGEVHALVGQNGSGKSTLIKILSGFHRPDPGSEAWVRGESTTFEDLAGATPIRTVHQDLGIIGGLSAIDNIGLGLGYESGRSGRVKWRQQAEHTRSLLARVTPEEVDLFKPMATAPRLHVTAVAVARVLDGWEHDGLLIFDEPTSALPNEEVGRLMSILRSLRDAGSSVVLVSHALDEVLEIADRVTVLRDGQRVTSLEVQGITENDLVETMLGDRKLPDHSAPPVVVKSAAPREDRGAALTVSGLTGIEVDDLDLEVKAGEVLGVTGLLGSGHLELAYLISGGSPAVDGVITIGGQDLPARSMTPTRSKELGIGFVPADRDKEGLIGVSTIAENISLPRLRSFQRKMLLRQAEMARDAGERIDRAGVRPPNPEARVQVLSGGNKQKVLLAKALANASQLLIIVEPTIGVDIGAKMDFYQQIKNQAEREGLGILVCSTDLTDLTAVCDRALAMRSGRIVTEFSSDQINEHELLAAISGFGATSEGVS